MAAASARVAPTAALFDDAPSMAHISLFKEDRPRRIDRVISFFGEDADAPQPRAETESMAWSER